MAKLSAAEKRLLVYPPTETTWECQGSLKVRLMDEIVDQACSMAWSGDKTKCLVCGVARRKRPKLLWPLYVAACKKAGIEPGDRWRDPASGNELALARATAARKAKKGSA